MEGGTGVFYQAMPAVGPDGKTVMKLIPVQKVNGQFVQSQTSTYRKDDVETQRVYAHPIRISAASVPQNKIPILQPTADGRFIIKGSSDINTLFNSVKGKSPESSNTSKNTPVQVHIPIVTPRVAQHIVPFPVHNVGKAVTLLNNQQLPVTVNSPVLPNGHYLQIPPNAKVRTLPASALPQSIKRRIWNSPNDCSNSAKGLPTVVYVSPVNSMKLRPPQQATSVTSVTPNPSRMPKPSGQTLATSSAPGSIQCSKSAPKAGQEPATPIKWVVQDGGGSTAPCLVPVSNTGMTSEILKAVAQMEKVSTCQLSVSKHSSPQDSQTKISPGNDNALVMCNGRVYFVAKKTNLCGSSEQHKGKPTKGVAVNGGVPTASPTLPSSSSAGSQASNATRQDLGHIVINDEPDEIIDLCDDDPQDDSLKTTDLPVTSQTEEDEDSNVIFVSYIPPKPSAESGGQDVTTVLEVEGINTEAGLEPERSQDNLTGQEEDNRMDGALGQEIENDQGSTSAESGGRGIRTAHEKDNTSNREAALELERCQDNADIQEMANSEDAAVGLLGRTYGQEGELVSGKVLTGVESRPVLDWRNQQKCDYQLIKKFGITSDIKICLHRIKSTPLKPVREAETRSINKRTLDGIRRLIQGSQVEFKTKKLIEAQVPSSKRKKDDCPKDAKRKKMEPPENAVAMAKSQDDLQQTSPSSPKPKVSPVSGPTSICDEEMPSESITPSADSEHSDVPLASLDSEHSSKHKVSFAVLHVQLQAEATTDLTEGPSCSPLTNTETQKHVTTQSSSVRIGTQAETTGKAVEQPAPILIVDEELADLMAGAATSPTRLQEEPGPSQQSTSVTTDRSSVEVGTQAETSGKAVEQAAQYLNVDDEQADLTPEAATSSDRLQEEPGLSEQSTSVTTDRSSVGVGTQAETSGKATEQPAQHLNVDDQQADLTPEAATSSTRLQEEPGPSQQSTSVTTDSSSVRVGTQAEASGKAVEQPAQLLNVNDEMADLMLLATTSTRLQEEPGPSQQSTSVTRDSTNVQVGTQAETSGKTEGKPAQILKGDTGLVDGMLLATTSSTRPQEEPDPSQESASLTTHSSSVSTQAKKNKEQPAVTPEGDQEQSVVEIKSLPTTSQHACNMEGEVSASDLFCTEVMDPEEIKRREKIKRLKELLKQKEAALEMIRKNMIL